MTITNLPLKSQQELSMIISALQREKKFLKWEIEKTHDRLKQFESQKNLKSDIFYQKYQAGEMGDGEEIMNWVGEYQFFIRFKVKLSRLEELITECQKLITTVLIKE